MTAAGSSQRHSTGILKTIIIRHLPNKWPPLFARDTFSHQTGNDRKSADKTSPAVHLLVNHASR
jgi:hypothetical protein